MRAKVKFGCLQNIESTNAGFHPMSNVRRITEEYRYDRLTFDLPDQGITRSELACPICSQSVTLRLSSPGVVLSILRMALLACGLICFVIAALLYLGPGASKPVAEQIAVGIGVLGIAFLLGAAFAEQVPTQWIKENLISIANDEVRNHPQEPGSSGARGHKLLEIHVS